MGYRILVVDDEKTIRDLIAFRLEFHGHQVEIAQNGTEALEKAHASVPELIVLDVMMPDLTGYEVCRKLKADPKTEQIKIILLTAKGGATDEAEGISAGADGFMSKPFRANVLIAKIDELLDGR